MDLKSLTVDLNRHLVNPKCKTVDHVKQLYFLKRTGGPELQLVEPKQLTVDLIRYLVEPKCKTVDHVEQMDFSTLTGGPEFELVDLSYI